MSVRRAIASMPRGWKTEQMIRTLVKGIAENPAKVALIATAEQTSGEAIAAEVRKRLAVMEITPNLRVIVL